MLISGSGSNLQALIDSCSEARSAAQIVAVISNRADAFGLERARSAGIETRLVEHRDFDSRESFDRALAENIDAFVPDLVVLAGFMRILSPFFTQKYAGKMLNIHPSLLPKYPGLHTHQRAIDAGDAEAGATVHFVTADLDAGPAVLQASVAIQPGDDAGRLAAKVLEQEHRIYPEALRWFASGRLELREGSAWLDGQALPAGGIRFNSEAEGPVHSQTESAS